MRFFGGLRVEAAAEALKVSPIILKRHGRAVKA
jgi:hypothetical protein